MTSAEQEPLVGQTFRNINVHYQYVHTEDRPPRRDVVVYLLLFASFLSSFCFSVIIPSIWQYFQTIGAGVIYLGWAVAAHSAGTMLAAPLLLMWARKRPLREVMSGTLLLMAIGKLALLLTSRLVVGASAAIHAVATAYLSTISNTRPTERIMVKNGIAVITGFIVGPALAMPFSFVELPIGSSNSTTTPGYFTAALAFIVIFPSIFWIVNPPPPPSSVSTRNTMSHPRQNSVASMFSSSGLSGYGLVNSVSYSGLGSVGDVASWYTTLISKAYRIPTIPFVVCFLTYFSLTASFVIWETVGSELTHTYLQWGVLQNGILFACMGLVAIIALWILKLLSHIVADKLILIASAVITGSGAAILIIPLGWAPVPFSIAMFLVALGYTLCINAALQLFSTVLEMNSEIPASAVIWLSYCGSVARIIGALSSTYILTWSGVLPLFITATVLPFLSALVAICCFYHLPV